MEVMFHIILYIFLCFVQSNENVKKTNKHKTKEKKKEV